MNSKTLGTALLYLSVGCMVIGVFELVTRGLTYAYLWTMLGLSLWLGQRFIQRVAATRRERSNATKTDTPGVQKSSAAKSTSVSKSKRKRK